MSQQPGNTLIIHVPETNLYKEIPGFTCSHCGRAKAPRVTSTLDPDEIDKRIKQWFDEKVVCRKCNHMVCDLCALVMGQSGFECKPFAADLEKAASDKWNQPWFLRDGGDPVYRLIDNDGHPILVPRKDVGYTDRQMENLAGELQRAKEEGQI